jgi:NAD(P)-dependent dehydrogenase (short-subunit alcohol dehydrogenase family)
MPQVRESAVKIAIVTGGSNGIGKGTALELARRGIGVILTYHSDKEGAEAVVREVEQTHTVRTVALELDLSAKATFDQFTRLVKQNLQDIWHSNTFDYLVNNGGTGGAMPFIDVSEQYFDKIFNTNFKGPYFLTQQLVKLMESGGGIVNISSATSRIAPPGYSVYGPTKAALSSWTRYLAKELAPRKIRVNTISPGPTHTNLADGAFDRHPEHIKPLGEQTALGRIGLPQDVAKVVVNLLSDDFGWVTAEDIGVSGGYLL